MSQLSLGRLAYLGWFRPLGILRTLATPAGLRDATLSRWGAEAMRRATARLAPLPTPAIGLPVHLLTGQGYWPLTAFAFHSLRRVVSMPLRPVFEDDGSLDAGITARLTSLFPGCTIRSTAEQSAALDEVLNPSRFPTLRVELASFLMLRKLIAPHAGNRGLRLVCDSDVLFFRPATQLEEWARSGKGGIYMSDATEAYVAPRDLVVAAVGAQPAPCLNAGLVGLPSELIDWERVEFHAHRLHARFGSSFFLEQTLYALIFGGIPAAPLPANLYVVSPAKSEALRPAAVAHHYAGRSRHLMYRFGWRHLASTRP